MIDDLTAVGSGRHGLAWVAAACGPAGLPAGLADALYPWVLSVQIRLDQWAAPPVLAGPALAVLLAGLAIVAPRYAIFLRVVQARPERPGNAPDDLANEATKE